MLAASRIQRGRNRPFATLVVALALAAPLSVAAPAGVVHAVPSGNPPPPSDVPGATLAIAPHVVKVGATFTATLSPKSGHAVTKVFWSLAPSVEVVGGMGDDEPSIAIIAVGGCGPTSLTCTYRVLGTYDDAPLDTTNWYTMGVGFQCREGDHDYCHRSGGESYDGFVASDSLGFEPDPRKRLTVNRNDDKADASTSDRKCDVDLKKPGSQCTLRAAIQQANAQAGAEVIAFALPAGKHVIAPRKPLPVVMSVVDIDATGSFPRPRLDGASRTAGANGLVLRGGSSRVARLSVTRWKGAGIRLEKKGGNRIEDCFIGTNESYASLGNLNGIVIDGSSRNTIGGPSASLANVISGNGRRSSKVLGTGITILDSTGNRIEGARIGVTADGTQALGNYGWGVLIGWRGTTRAPANPGNIITGSRIAGNLGGVAIAGGTSGLAAGAAGNTVQLSTIGTAVPNGGSTATSIPAQHIGILVYGKAPGTTIGGLSTGLGNHVSHNTVGVVLAGSLTGTLVARNRIGTDSDGKVAEPNGVGILAAGGPFTIGGDDPGTGNIIAGNRDGEIVLANAKGGVVRRNLVGLASGGLTQIGASRGKVGIVVTRGSTDNQIGQPGDGNVVGGEAAGVVIVGGSRNTIQSTAVGADLNRAKAIPNGIGIYLNGAVDTTVGGSAAGSGNTVSGNVGDGVVIGTGPLPEFSAVQHAAFDNYLTRNPSIQQLLAYAASKVGGIKAPSGVTGSVIKPPAPPVPDRIVIAGNRVGTTGGGHAKLPNGAAGINVAGALGVTIGGTTGTTPNTACAGACNLVSGNGGDGIAIGAASTKILGNFIGTNLEGTAVLGNAGHGVRSRTSSTTIGDTVEGARNLISGNGGRGVFGSAGAILGNRIGTNAAGTARIRNVQGGVDVVGSFTEVKGNLVSGNGEFGLRIFGDDGSIFGSTQVSNEVVITGNRIGTNAAGTDAVPNVGPGIWLRGPSAGATVNDATIGGPAAAERNLVSGNTGDGIHLDGAFVSGARIIGNDIGVGANGTCTPAAGVCPTGNGGAGIHGILAPDIAIEGGPSGSEPNCGAACNTIAGNAVDGIWIEGDGGDLLGLPSSVGSRVRQNRIGMGSDGSVIGNGRSGVRLHNAVQTDVVTNWITGNHADGIAVTESGGAGNKSFGNNFQHNVVPADGGAGGNGDQPIDLGDDGATANDVQDTDSGPNGLQNHPGWAAGPEDGGMALYPVRSPGTSTAVTVPFYLKSRASLGGVPAYRIDFYACAGRWLGYTDVTLPVDGDDAFTGIRAPVLSGVPLTVTEIAMTASYTTVGTYPSTSEMSACQSIQ